MNRNDFRMTVSSVFAVGLILTIVDSCFAQTASDSWTVSRIANAQWDNENSYFQDSQQYEGQPLPWSFEYESFTTDRKSYAITKYEMLLNGSEFGAGVGIQKDYGIAVPADAFALSHLDGRAQIIDSQALRQANGHITQLQVNIPIHGEVTMRDSTSTFPEAIKGRAVWSFDFEEAGQILYETNGTIEFDSVYRDRPSIDDYGDLVNSSQLRYSPLGDYGWLVEGSAELTFPVSLVRGDIFEASFTLQTAISSGSQFAPIEGSLDFTNTSSFELRALDASGNVLPGTFYAPISAVPEPSVAVVFPLFLGTLMYRRRR